jgi:hypothetical protein
MKGGSLPSALRRYTNLRGRRDVGPRIKSVDFSNLYLMWQFGFAPLISDMRKVVASISSLKSQIAKAAANAGKPYSVTAKAVGTWSLTGTEAMSGYSPIDPPESPNLTWWHPRLFTLGAPLRLVGVRGVRTQKFNTSGFQQLDYLMSRFLSPGPTWLLWERIPFSFVVDWFVDLSGIFDQLNETLTGNTKQVRDIWSSESWHVKVGAVKHTNQNWITNYDGIQTVATTMKYYHREPLDASVLPVSSGRFGKKQALLAGALLHQLVANLKRSRK